MPGVRIDKLLVQLGLSPSRERARAMIMAGNVLVNDSPVTKAGTSVEPDADIRVRGDDNPFVSRGGLKLDGALNDLGIEMNGRIVLDVGSSTGGFTDCCLQRGAKRVFAVDVGTHQLAYRLRQDPRVCVMEKTNARNLTPSMLDERPDIAVIDVSFISIKKLLGPVATCLDETGSILAMVKPQFEAGREKVGKGGVVRDADVREETVVSVVEHAAELGFHLAGRTDSRILGPKGNQETFIYLIVGARPAAP